MRFPSLLALHRTMMKPNLQPTKQKATLPVLHLYLYTSPMPSPKLQEEMTCAPKNAKIVTPVTASSTATDSPITHKDFSNLINLINNNHQCTESRFTALESQLTTEITTLMNSLLTEM
ncbi:hypothetical protein CHUAL_009084 [Chamberlinius hualienensis]